MDIRYPEILIGSRRVEDCSTAHEVGIKQSNQLPKHALRVT